MKLEVLRCLKCGHYWTQNITAKTALADFNLPENPKRCPKCKSLNWNRIHQVIAKNASPTA
jgi:predicted nucleic-acid-binding Zn-ribbon protein